MWCKSSNGFENSIFHFSGVHWTEYWKHQTVWSALCLVGCRPSPPPLSLSFKHKERNIKKEPPTEFTMATFSWNSPSELWITTPCLIAFEKNWKRNQLIKNQSLKATWFFIVLIFESSWIVEFSIVSQFSISFKLCYVQNWNH